MNTFFALFLVGLRSRGQEQVEEQNIIQVFIQSKLASVEVHVRTEFGQNYLILPPANISPIAPWGIKSSMYA